MGRGWNRETLRFGAVAAGIALGAIALWHTELFRQTLQVASIELHTWAAAGLLRLLGEDARSTGVLLHSSRAFLRIGSGCDAVLPLLVFAGAILGFPVAPRARLAGVIAGGAFLMALNQARIVSLYYTKILAPGAFDLLHRDVWQAAFVLLAAVAWIVWAAWALRPGVEPA